MAPNDVLDGLTIGHGAQHCSPEHTTVAFELKAKTGKETTRLSHLGGRRRSGDLLKKWSNCGFRITRAWWWPLDSRFAITGPAWWWPWDFLDQDHHGRLGLQSWDCLMSFVGLGKPRFSPFFLESFANFSWK